MRNERFNDRKAKIQYNLDIVEHRLDRLNQEAKPLFVKKAQLEADLKKVVIDHENFEDHQLYVAAPLTSIMLSPEEEIKELEAEIASHAAISKGIRDRIEKLKRRR